MDDHRSSVILLDLAKFEDKWGLTQPWEEGSSGNGILYTAHRVLLLSELGLLTQQEKRRASESLNHCEVENGLIRRSPSNPDQEGPDDQFGALTISYFTDGGAFARRWLKYGRTSGPKFLGDRIPFWFSNVSPGEIRYPAHDPKAGNINWSAFMLRFPALIAHAKWAAGETPNPFEQLYWAASLLKRRPKGDQDGWVMSYHMVAVAGDQNVLTRFCAKIFRRRFFAYYPAGMGELLGDYFKNRFHPLAQHWPVPENGE